MKEKTTRILSMILFGALLFWGVFTLFAYLGVPVHQSVLVHDDQATKIQQTCGSLFCRGALAFVPSIVRTISRMSPFYWYIGISALLYAGFVLWNVFVRGSGRLRARLRPWHFLALFLSSLFLFFNVLSFGTSDGSPMTRIVEPKPEVYTNVSEEGLKTLQRNFDDLLNRGCLTLAGQSDSGVGIYDMSASCIEGSFITRVLSQVAVAGTFLFELLVAGHMLLVLLGLRPRRLLTEAVISVGIGAGAWIAVLWTLAISSLYTANVGWILVIAVPILCYRSAWYWIQKFYWSETQHDVSWYDLSILLLWLIVSYLAINFLTVVRPFPIGWDDLGSYLNRPRLLVSYGSFIFSMSQFQWEYLTSLGFLLFGYTNPFAATASMIINWTEGLLAILSVFLLANTFFGKRKGLLAALLYYSLPLVGHFSFADMKIDNAVFTMGALATFTLFTHLFDAEEPQSFAHAQAQADENVLGQNGLPTVAPRRRGEGWRWLLITGVFAGLAFSMKPTAIMVVMEIIAILFAVLFHWTAFLGMAFFAFAVFAYQNVFNVEGTFARMLGGAMPLSRSAFMILCLVLGTVCVAYAVVRSTSRPRWKPLLSFGVFVIGVLAAISPWMTYNNIQAGNIVPRVAMGAPNTISPQMQLWGSPSPPDHDQPVRSLPADLQVNHDDPSCKATGATEELDRYWGFDQGIGHYALLPWRTVLNLDSAGYYVTTSPSLFLFPLLLLVPFFWMRKARWLRYLFAGTLFVIVEWIFLANGIPWYGVGMFLGLSIGMEGLIAEAPDLWSRATAGTLIGLSLVIVFAMRIWQFEQQRNIFEYPMGKISAEALSQRTIPWYDTIQKIVTDRHRTIPGRPYLYRVGTFIPYFIPKNLEVIGLADAQLDTFHCISQGKDPRTTVNRLKALGFNSIIFDTNTSTIERDPGGSLHKKVNDFVDFLNTPGIGLQIVINDPSAGVAFVLIH
ncbi:hypothetical protein HY285_03775 [Candidatus Peregrinibacteria bacterium]|nr:hypothetical protein [Candidatus Peregrinibacteria bacterium]MBI3816635.1 hypothetical protein [Candidatus Peregrinibacteria bacterium]